ncbi:MAG: hypothetical protein JWQ87_977 [Candidatus Sulfotelmatobacter sp.]|nr:hypothetical protein [Candidatus Sulfotelmatobacter sp.]
MTVTINLPPQVEQAYLAEAKARGLPLAEVMREALVAAQPAAAASELSSDEWLRRFKAWTASHADVTVVLPDEAMERESISADRGL